MDSHKKTIISCRNSANASKIKKNSGNFSPSWVHGSITLHKIRWLYDSPRMHYTNFSALFATVLRSYYIFTWISLRISVAKNGNFSDNVRWKSLRFLKVSEVLSRGNRSMIDSRQAIFSLNVVIFSNNYKRSEKSYGITAASCNDMSLILVCSFVNFIAIDARSFRSPQYWL